MRFVWAVVAFVLATVLIGAGIAQRTIFMGPSEQRMELTVDQPTPYVLIDADVLRANPGLQTLLVRGQGDIFVAYGRTADMKAWLSDTAYNGVTLTKSGKAKSAVVDAQQAPASGGDTSGRSPVGSDLWLDSFADQDSLVADLQLTKGTSVLVARDGVEPAPSDLLVTWDLDTRTPWAGPLMAAGALLLAIGLVLYVLGIRHQRRGRGPRRKGPGPLPETQPLIMPQRDELEATTGTADDRLAPRTASTRRRLALAFPALALTAVLATGCSADSWPQLGASTPTPTPTPTVVTPENQKPPVITQKQGKRIISEISTILAKADSARDAALVETRLTGPALAARQTEYVLRGEIADRDTALIAPLDDIKILLPEATEGWPRTVLALTAAKKSESQPPILLAMTQADPWADYRVTSMSEMPASGEFPKVAPAWLGTTRVPAESAFLSLEPSELAEAFSDYVDAGDKSEYAGRFDDVAGQLATAVQDSRAALLKKAVELKADKTSKAVFDMKPADYEPLSLATLESGAVVAVSVDDIQTVTSTSPDAVIKFGTDAEAKALTGVSESSKGYVTTYGFQLFFAVPPQGTNQQIRLLAYHQDILNVKVIK